jgi:phosphatidylethanolamine-binding protein (PEBP) family uncharacterized protein
MMGPQLQLSSSAFADGSSIPDKYTCAAGMGNMTSPALNWVNPPKGTESFVLLLHDPDAHAGKSSKTSRTGSSSTFRAMRRRCPRA